VFGFFVVNATRPFGYLSCTDFDNFWNNRRESLSAYVHRWKIFPFLRRGFPSPEITQNTVLYGRVSLFVIELQLKWHKLWTMRIISGASLHPKDVLFVREFWWGTYGLGAISPRKSPKFWRLHYLSWPNRITVGVNNNRNRLPLGALLYSYNRQQLITTMSTRERLQRDRATPEMNCWDDMRRFNVTRKRAARSLGAYIAACLQTHCNPSIVVMVALCNRETIYIFMLWFVLFLSFFSSPNLSRRRLDVYHTLAHGVVLV